MNYYNKIRTGGGRGWTNVLALMRLTWEKKLREIIIYSIFHILRRMISVIVAKLGCSRFTSHQLRNHSTGWISVSPNGAVLRIQNVPDPHSFPSSIVLDSRRRQQSSEAFSLSLFLLFSYIKWCCLLSYIYSLNRTKPCKDMTFYVTLNFEAGKRHVTLHR